jgi:hypothetical protein
MVPGYDGGSFPLRTVIVRHVRNADGTVSTTVEGAGPWYSFQETRDDDSGKRTIQLGGVILGTEQQTPSRILIDHANGFSAVVVVPFIDDKGNPSSSGGRAVERADLDRIASTIDFHVKFVLNLYPEFKAELLKRLGVTPPNENDIYAWCCLVRDASDSGIIDQVINHFARQQTTH